MWAVVFLVCLFCLLCALFHVLFFFLFLLFSLSSPFLGFLISTPCSSSSSVSSISTLPLFFHYCPISSSFIFVSSFPGIGFVPLLFAPAHSSQQQITTRKSTKKKIEMKQTKRRNRRARVQYFPGGSCQAANGTQRLRWARRWGFAVSGARCAALREGEFSAMVRI